MTTPEYSPLLEKIDSLKAKIAVIGLGYVGLPLAIEFANAGFEVLGIEKEPSVVNVLLAGKSHVSDFADGEVRACLNLGLKVRRIEEAYLSTPLTVKEEIAECDVFIICVPTPLKVSGGYEPNIEYIIKATKIVEESIKISNSKRKLIILESTTYPGCTEEIMLPRLRSILPVEEIELAYSPERTNPGGAVKFTDIPKIIGALNESSLSDVQALYGKIFTKGTVDVGTMKAAEMIKCAENGYRFISISFTNRLAQKWRQEERFDIWQVAKALQVRKLSLNNIVPSDILSDPKLSDIEVLQKLISINGLDKMSLQNDELSIESITQELTDKIHAIPDGKLEVEGTLDSVFQAFQTLSVLYLYQVWRLSDALSIDFKKVMIGILTKPFGLGFCLPGPGTGGHCIPIDPLYLYWRGVQCNTIAPIIYEAFQIDEEMPNKIFGILKRCLNEKRIPINGAKVILLGITYKENSADLRESKIFELAKILHSRGVNLSYCDPVFWERRKGLYPSDESKTTFFIEVVTRELPGEIPVARKYYIEELGTEKAIMNLKDGRFDCAIIFSHHDRLVKHYFEIVGNHNLMIIDTRNVIEGLTDRKHPNVYVLGRA